MDRSFGCSIGFACCFPQVPLFFATVCFLLSGICISHHSNFCLFLKWLNADFFDVRVLPWRSDEQLFHAFFASGALHLRDAVSHASSYNWNVTCGSGCLEHFVSNAQGRSPSKLISPIWRQIYCNATFCKNMGQLMPPTLGVGGLYKVLKTSLRGDRMILLNSKE